jgi:putative transposase
MQEYYYHVYNRGNNYQAIFFERENYLHFLRLIRQYLVSQKIVILAYCLMPNHYHFLVKCDRENLSKAMKLVSLAYTKGINKRFNRVGALFQGKFKAALVDSDEYLVHLVRYIHLNPVKAGLVQNAQEWEFSSYCEYAGVRNGTLPQLDVIRSLFDSQMQYQSFLEGYTLPLFPQVVALMLDE